MIWVWAPDMRKLRIHPKAVCRQLITVLDEQKTVSREDMCRVLFAIKSTGVPVEQVLATLRKDTLEKIIDLI